MSGVTLTMRDRDLVLSALDDARSVVARKAQRYADDGVPVPGITIELGERLDRAISVLLPASIYHDAGAWARCSKCGRYTTSVFAIGDRCVHPCDCGETDYWTGSFERPGPDAKWHTQVQPWSRRGREVSP